MYSIGSYRLKVFVQFKEWSMPTLSKTCGIGFWIEQSLLRRMCCVTFFHCNRKLSLNTDRSYDDPRFSNKRRANEVGRESYEISRKGGKREQLEARRGKAKHRYIYISLFIFLVLVSLSLDIPHGLPEAPSTYYFKPHLLVEQLTKFPAKVQII